ncbi:hypothetical protein DPMN_061191 [Dreissena polymorpha]|uniref:Uncharacterized protein n=1 Tax=Dreissena polymorpha TaxID=45954 RepID=A0A9D4C6J6_DREPO|nr:hypothetical protein DPMN_061191 [Dreissena polymorpha]
MMMVYDDDDERLMAHGYRCADSIPVLPSIEEIILRNVTCSSSCLLSLFSTLLTVNHEVFCCLQGIFIECQEGAKWKIRVLINKGLDMKFSITINDDSPYIWKVLHGLNIKTLCLSGDLRDLDVHHVEWSRSLSSLTHLETLEIETTQVNLFKALHGLNIKSLSIDQSHINVDYVDSCSQSLASLKHLETLSIKASNNINGLWKALHGLAIKRLIIEQGDLNMDDVESPSQSLSSLTQLEMLILCVHAYKQLQLPQSLTFLSIYCHAVLPSRVLELVDLMPTCTQAIEVFHYQKSPTGGIQRHPPGTEETEEFKKNDDYSSAVDDDDKHDERE